ncbi:hypothetical protein O6H91_20G026600 [Diphasiastrum complanatum]|uniref:Uncharacterized protein n=1 Tax=Diphasiastrum complanatum TaxID=34168 RepID=A0ACC2APW1_DIPCM|nr:hypothetical protein O6H91_Y012200 [Diphasiastrum complanatum]KAJ7519182.1 hypothetical protein O6H91_20G026600 [Diphasiastrum complanatum]
MSCRCVGIATAAFARAILEGSTQAGVWFPEEDGALDVPSRQKLLDRASQGAFNFLMNKPPWMVETVAKEIGFGIFLQ